MKNTLTDLNNYLFEQLERLYDNDLTPEQLEIEMKRSDQVVKVSETIIQNGELAFKTMQHIDKYGYNSQDRAVPPMLETKGEWK